jgi:transcriptional regulator with XRE-family HTH domain
MTDSTSTARRRELGAQLRRIRELRGFNGLDMATRLCWTPSMVSRAETGKRPMTPLEVATYSGLCGVAGHDQEALLELASEPDDYRIKSHGGKIPDELKTLIFHESTANQIESFQPIYIPGITQTEDYARALFRETGFLGTTEIENRVQIRLSRRNVLTREDPAQCTFFVHENALRMQIGSPQIMQEQMLHLLFAGSRPQCSIRVIPTSAGGRGTAGGSFQVFSYRDGAPVVCVQHEATSEFLESTEELACHRGVLNRVANVALDDAESREFIAWMASDYERRGVTWHGESGGLAQEQP